MRFFFSFLLSIIVGSTQAQNTNSPVTNSKSTQEEKPAVDSTYLKQELESIDSKKKGTYRVAEAKDEDSEFNQSAIQSYSTTFNYSKQQSSLQRTQRSPSVDQQKQMDAVVDKLEENAPESFEYHYFKYVSGNYDVSLFDHLKKAENLKPNNSDVQSQMVAYYVIKGDLKNSLIYLNKLVENSKLTKEVIDYSEDLLQSAPENGVLITHGFDDTYSTAYLQQNKKIRTDVQIVSLDFLQSDEYRKSLKDKGFVIPLNEKVDVQFLKEFCTKNSTKPLSISMTTPKEYLLGIQENLFMVGLVFEYNTDLNFDNFYKNNYLWNEVFTKKIIDAPKTEKSKQLGSNYLPMLLHLRNVYSQKKDIETVEKLDATIDKIAVQCKKYDQVQKLKGSY